MQRNSLKITSQDNTFKDESSDEDMWKSESLSIVYQNVP
jgi:hypothetical protein